MGLDLVFEFRVINVSFTKGVVAPRPTPKLEDQGISFSLGYQLSGMGVPASSYTTARIALGVMTKEAPPLRQSTNTFGGGTLL